MPNTLHVLGLRSARFPQWDISALQAGQAYRVTARPDRPFEFERIVGDPQVTEGEIRVFVGTKWLGLMKTVSSRRWDGATWVAWEMRLDEMQAAEPAPKAGAAIPDKGTLDFARWDDAAYRYIIDEAILSRILDALPWFDAGKKGDLIARLKNARVGQSHVLIDGFTFVLDSKLLNAEWKQRWGTWILSPHDQMGFSLCSWFNELVSEIQKIEGADLNEFLRVICTGGHSDLNNLSTGYEILEYLNAQSLTGFEKLEFIKGLKTKSGGDLFLAWERTEEVARLLDAIKEHDEWGEIYEPFQKSDRVWLTPNTDDAKAMEEGKAFLQRAVELNFPYEVSLMLAYKEGIFYPLLHLGSSKNVINDPAGLEIYWVMAHTHPADSADQFWPSYGDIVGDTIRAQQIEDLIISGKLPINFEVPGFRAADGTYNGIVYSHLGAVRIETKKSGDSWHVHLRYANGKKALDDGNIRQIKHDYWCDESDARIGAGVASPAHGRGTGNIWIRDITFETADEFEAKTGFKPVARNLSRIKLPEKNYGFGDVKTASNREMVGGLENNLHPGLRKVQGKGHGGASGIRGNHVHQHFAERHSAYPSPVHALLAGPMTFAAEMPITEVMGMVI